MNKVTSSASEEPNEPVSRFAWFFQQGISAWTKAGKIVVEEIEKDPSFPERVAEKFKHISEQTVKVFQRIGLKQIHPELYMSDKPGARMLLRLPYATQEKHLREPVELLIQTAKGWETILADVDKLTKDQAEQVFDRDGIRDAAAQRLWLEDRKVKSFVPAKTNLPWRKVKGSLVIMEPCTFTKKELMRILADLE